jgi:mannose-6-phosphate isomerase-like protein (cupin superfamily)
MTVSTRRVVTAQNAAGRSYVLEDGPAKNVVEMASMPGTVVMDLWETLQTPASNAGTADGAARPIRHEPPRGGTLFRIVKFPPDAAWKDSIDPQRAFDSIGGGHTRVKSSGDPLMHKSDTIDYLVVLEGEIHAVFDEGETLLRKGDVLVQRGTTHSWSNRSNDSCVIAVVLISAEPI